MTRVTRVAHQFVDYVPDDLVEDTIYVSTKFATASHKCCCGCGNEVITPLSPTDWRLIYDGRSISLDPSIGNWSFPCKSHYWIQENRVMWAPRWTQSQIDAARTKDRAAKAAYFGVSDGSGIEQQRGAGVWERVKAWFSR